MQHQLGGQRRGTVRLFILGLVPAIVLIGSGSISSMLVVGALGVSIVALRFVGNAAGIKRVVKVLVALLAVAVMGLSLLALAPQIMSLDFVLERLGRDRTLTGRLEVWELGFRIWAEKPWLGWGFDSLNSVIVQLRVDATQFHNGYIDLAIRGGVFGFLLFATLCVSMARRLSSLSKESSILANGLAAFVIGVLVHNITEASIMRPTNLYWFVFVFVYLLTAVLARPGYRPLSGWEKRIH